MARWCRPGLEAIEITVIAPAEASLIFSRCTFAPLFLTLRQTQNQTDKPASPVVSCTCPALFHPQRCPGLLSTPRFWLSQSSPFPQCRPRSFSTSDSSRRNRPPPPARSRTRRPAPYICACVLMINTANSLRHTLRGSRSLWRSTGSCVAHSM